ncbi:MAG: VWA domain-containing protein [Bacteroidota bacterium]
MFRFEHIEFLYALAIVPVFLFIYWLNVRWRKKAIQQFATSNRVPSILKDLSKGKRTIKITLLAISYTSLVLALANPQMGTKMEEVKREGIDLMICLDVSNSMMAEDLFPNRLDHAKRAISKLIEQLRDDRIGMVVFGGEAYVQLPITTDFSAAKLFLESINTDIIPTQGTNIAAAIETAMLSFDPKSTSGKAVIIITDGENHEEGALEMAEKAKANGIRIFTVGMGSQEGSPIPVYQNGKPIGYKKDKENNTVITKLNEPMLQQLAMAGNGTYARATNSQTALNSIFNEINKMDKQSFGTQVYRDYESRFQLFLAPALLLLIIEIFISSNKSKWWTKLNLFKKEEI